MAVKKKYIGSIVKKYHYTIVVEDTIECEKILKKLGFKSYISDVKPSKQSS
jgi:adenylate cyclase class IV